MKQHQPQELEMFSESIKGVVTISIALYEVGQVKVHGQLWRAQLYDLNCQNTLLIGQPVLAVGRERLTLFVIPNHCLLWDLYIDQFWPCLTNSDIELMQKYERFWRN